MINEKALVAHIVFTSGISKGIQGMRKPKAIATVNKIMDPFTKGIFKDDSWVPVHKIFEALRQAEIDYEIESADYQHDSEGRPKGKRWKMVVHYLNEKGNPTTIYGQIVASGCASCESPLDSYDLIAYFS